MRKRKIIVGVLGVLLVVAGAGRYRRTHTEPKQIVNVPTSTEAIPSASPDGEIVGGGIEVNPSRSTVASGDYVFSFTTKDGLSREYNVHIPTGYDSTKAYPVLFGFHGGFGNAKQFERSSHISTIADKKGYIVVYGQGTTPGVLNAPVWNAGACCGAAQQDKKNIDDVSYVRDVVGLVKAKYNIDSARIFMTGMSNGGMLVNRLACEASDIFAGGAVVAGTIVINSCKPTRRVPLLIMHGTKDENVPYNGGQGDKSFNRTVVISVTQEFADWGKRNGCSGAIETIAVPPLVQDGRTVDRLTYAMCAKPLVLYRVNGGIHEWPGGDANQNLAEKPLPTKVINASETIFDFFATIK